MSLPKRYDYQILTLNEAFVGVNPTDKMKEILAEGYRWARTDGKFCVFEKAVEELSLINVKPADMSELEDDLATMLSLANLNTGDTAWMITVKQGRFAFRRICRTLHLPEEQIERIVHLSMK